MFRPTMHRDFAHGFMTSVCERAAQCPSAKISILDAGVYRLLLLVFKDLFYVMCLCPQRPQEGIDPLEQELEAFVCHPKWVLRSEFRSSDSTEPPATEPSL